MMPMLTKIAKDFTARVKEKAIGQDVRKGSCW
jgi:hypothetical protein